MIAKIPIGTQISGNEIDSFFNTAISNNLNDFYAVLSKYNGDILFEQWLQLIKSIDELINIPSELPEQLALKILSQKVNINVHCDPCFFNCLDTLKEHFGIYVAKRVGLLICQSACVIKALRDKGIETANVTNYNDLVKFFQSRRKYYVSFLALIKQHSHGNEKIHSIDLLNFFQYYIEVILMGVTTAFNYLTINKSVDGFVLTSTNKGLESNQLFNQLDNFFLEPIRTSIVDQQEYSEEYNQSEIISKQKGILYSPSELDDMIHNTKVLFDCYGICRNRKFRELLSLIEFIRPYYKDDYYIIIPKNQFELHFKNDEDLAYQSYENNYFDILNSHAAFYKHKDSYISNIFLVNRYFYYATQNILDKTKRYQIRSGFIFEQKVSSVLEKYGFKDQKITRINKKEFDVVCTKGNCIYNFQCKNNLFNIATIDTRQYKEVAKCNRKLVNYYTRAYQKEIKREDLLTGYINISKIKHFVISRFPVIINNQEFIINFNDLESKLAADIL